MEPTLWLSPADKELVEQRTAGYFIWQNDHWTVRCGRACIYVGEAKASDLTGRWASAVPSMFVGFDYAQDEIDHVLNSIGSNHCCAYVFNGQIGKKLQGYWDCD